MKKCHKIKFIEAQTKMKAVIGNDRLQQWFTYQKEKKTSKEYEEKSICPFLSYFYATFAQSKMIDRCKSHHQ